MQGNWALCLTWVSTVQLPLLLYCYCCYWWQRPAAAAAAALASRALLLLLPPGLPAAAEALTGHLSCQ
jgi:hypothetical protein